MIRRIALAGILVLLMVTTSAASGALPRGFSYLRHVDASILQDMRYASADNFTGKKVAGYHAGECILRSETARALARVQAALRPRGYSLKVYDCYRPARAVKAFGVWAKNLKDLSTKHYFPRLPKSGLYGKGYIASRSVHSRGFAVDLTLVKLPPAKQPVFDPDAAKIPCTAPKSQRPRDNSVDMGTAFDCFDVKSHTKHPRIPPLARANRQRLKSAMGREGFVNYHREWWHYSYKKRRYPRTYYDFPVNAAP